VLGASRLRAGAAPKSRAFRALRGRTFLPPTPHNLCDEARCRPGALVEGAMASAPGQARAQDLAARATVAIITALPEELAAMKKMLHSPVE